LNLEPKNSNILSRLQHQVIKTMLLRNKYG
jgi:hypothetical protein